jgi:hypothetical protein
MNSLFIKSKRLQLVSDCVPRNEAWVPHISLVFREMWVYHGAYTETLR